MAEQRFGLSFDSHPRDEARPCRIGGVLFEGEPGLAGHSDADVLCHAVADAVLGAAGLGDLGEHFPETDPAFAGSDTLATARAMASAIEVTGPFDVVLAGRNSVDADTGQVGPELAELLDLPFLTGVRHLAVDGATAYARCTTSSLANFDTSDSPRSDLAFSYAACCSSVWCDLMYWSRTIGRDGRCGGTRGGSRRTPTTRRRRSRASSR